MLHTKENQFIRLEYENDGSLNGFCPKARSNSLRKYPLWRAVISYNGRKEIELRPAGACAVSEDGDRIEFRFDCGEDRNGKRYPVSILCKGVFKADEIHWSLCVENTLEGSVVREIQFPVLSLGRDSEPFSILTSRLGGEKVNNFFTTIGDHATAYFRQDNRVVRYTSLYPGCFSAMNFLNIDFGSHGIYCGIPAYIPQPPVHLLSHGRPALFPASEPDP